MSRSTPWPTTSVNMEGPRQSSIETLEHSAEDAPTTFTWDGDLSFLVDSGFVDASQAWLWTDNLNFDSFNETDDL